MKRCLTGLAALVLSALPLHGVHAAPALPGQLQFTNSGGQVFSGQLKGDEWLSWVETQSGHVAIRAANGRYEFARLQNGKLVASGAPAAAATGAQPGLLRADDPAFRAFVKNQQRQSPNQVNSVRRSTVYGAPGSSTVLNPGEGRNRGGSSVWDTLTAPPSTIPLLVVILEFNDQQLRSPVSTWSQKIFGTASGQMNAYYSAISQGRFQFTPAREIEGTANDGIVKIRLNMNHPNLGTAVGTTERYAALDKLDIENLIDFASYDTNRDGILSKEELQIIYLYSGGESATGSSLPSVWAHMTSDWGVVHDGVEFRNNYSRFGERHFSPPGDNDATIGIIAHELGHAAFGLPDLYDYDGSSAGTGPFCLMSYGSWGYAPGQFQGASPAPMSAWPRYRLGFAPVNEVTPGTPLTSTLLPVSQGGGMTLVPTDQPQEYFLVENRYPAGLDISLASQGSGGLMIWHIDESRYSNSDDNFRIVDFEGDDALYQWFWPVLNQNKTVFNNTSTPNSRRNDGTATGVTIGQFSVASDSTHAGTFTAEKKIPTTLPSLNFRGTPNNWASTAMVPVAANIWETTQTFASGVTNARFKFDVYGNWATNYGDTNRDGVLEPGGGDIPAPATPGTYVIQVNDSTLRYTITRVNQKPIANAGPDRIVMINSDVTLDGSASTDPDGTIATYSWNTGQTGKVVTTRFTSPAVRIITLTVTDDKGDSSTDDVIIDVRTSLPNQLPTARIAAISGATVGQPVTFDGSASSDLDGTISTYSWTVSGVPGTLGGKTTSFTFTAAGTYTVTLTVTDNAGDSASATATVVVSSGGFAKVYPQVYYRGTTNNWATTTPMSLTSNNTWSTTVVVPTTGTQTFKFDVNGDWTLNFGDNNADGLADQGGGNIVFPAGGGTFNITFNDSTRRYTVTRQSTGNQLPVAVAGANQTITGAATVALNGSSSYDPDGTIASWQWTLVSGPAVVINNANQSVASVSLPQVSTTTTWRFALQVTDNSGASATSEMTVTANPVQTCRATYAAMKLRGTNNAWGSTPMTLTADCQWEATATFGSTTTERFKFDVNGDWVTNFGDTNADGTAEQGGGDIRITQGAGNYLIRFNDTTKRYTITRQ